MKVVHASSLGRKVTRLVMATTAVALLVAAAALMVYDVSRYNDGLRSDLTTQADILARATAPAVAFNDPIAAEGDLALLRGRANLLAAAIYTKNGSLFAAYSQGQSEQDIPHRALAPGFAFHGNAVAYSHRIIENDEVLGSVYIRTRYDVSGRLLGYVAILATVMLGSLLIAGFVSRALARTVTEPVLEVARTAKQVIERRDFALRVKRTTNDEVGTLVDAFNAMLEEVGQRTAALQEANYRLNQEMEERTAAENALHAADKRKDEFLATLAHELRNPLSPIRSGVSVLRIANDPATVSKTLTMMERQLTQMVRLIDDLLNVSRITSGKIHLQMASISLQTVLEQAIEASRPTLDGFGHALKTRLVDYPLWVSGDATRLGQVFSNLLTNAAKYTPEGGEITLVTEVDHGWVRVQVQDNGVGIPKEALDNVFDLFTQVRAVQGQSQGGLGVGLWLVKKLVEMHGGTVGAHSDGPSRGSTFSVRLPLDSRSPLQEKPEAELEQENVRATRVLIVDDNQDAADSMAMLLSVNGHDVRTAYSARHALDVSHNFTPEVALVDIGMPEVSGLELAKWLRDDPRFSRTLLVALTGWGRETDKHRTREAGFAVHLTKPVDLTALNHVLAAAREQRMLHGSGHDSAPPR